RLTARREGCSGESDRARVGLSGLGALPARVGLTGRGSLTARGRDCDGTVRAGTRPAPGRRAHVPRDRSDSGSGTMASMPTPPHRSRRTAYNEFTRTFVGDTNSEGAATDESSGRPPAHARTAWPGLPGLPGL